MNRTAKRGAFDYLLDPDHKAPEPPVPPREPDRRIVHITVELVPYQTSLPKRKSHHKSALVWALAAAGLASLFLSGCAHYGHGGLFGPWDDQPPPVTQQQPVDPPMPVQPVNPVPQQDNVITREQWGQIQWALQHGGPKPAFVTDEQWREIRASAEQSLTSPPPGAAILQNWGFFEQMWENE
jgi:hypothetical protein